ncbi:MAG: FKBP-type peptidyl-prolyl cis-trans isomerase [Bacteroidaceae bacterium]|nr:FKBP-type peptidyl-prolyl cis-trans isomerase [Prevotellaceae bacterium]MDY2849530.1 FKBP-type peptidyl-prolyl cis-trans isomerase [Bacteroidaceae bacterium]
MKRIVLSTLILLVAAGTVCAQKKASKKKVAKKAKTEAAAPVKIAPDTVNVKDFSYCLGAANSNGLKQYLQQQLRIDTAQYMDDFLRGFKEAANDPTNAKMKAYAAGLQIADQVMNQMLPQANKQITDNRDSAFVNQAEFLRGFLEATTNSGSVTSDSAMKVAERQMEYYHDQLMEKKYGENRIAGEKFLAENAKKDSVVTLPSGLQYKIIKAGTGEKPGENSKVEVNYEGRLIDGTVFDSSYKRNKPQEFSVNGVVPGFSEALKLMPAGSTWEIYIPQELAYGARETRNSPIKPFSTLIFKVELISVKAAPQPKIPATVGK